ncbi:IS4 family transposase ISMmg3 [Paraburkholderia aspalathi]|uniref:IS4 family transposase ISMmg3 n=1 Tax=Paraburkholderia aspalathi TaxID=1324617 RepID=A0ABM8T8Y3_9BURK|nr:transposase [Paraburkholderia aspalathi]MBK3836286.1 transposase [Paraburkholderia aspalathi]MBK3866046.1 transposase [Paraburkholderia aspalathi]CAE6872621.1 IS4 family transposase ISMmg3 [Paraburkholderia aspalathi]
MGNIEKLADEVRRGLEQALPGLRKTILKKLPLAVAAMIEARTPNTMELSTVLPLATERADMREQWLRRLLKNSLLEPATILEPMGRQALQQAGGSGQTILLSMDQTDLGERFAVLMLSVRTGDRALPLAWLVESGEANIGWTGQQRLLERVRNGLPEHARVMLLADRFYPSAALFAWLKEASWSYRIRLKGNLLVDVGDAAVTTTGDLAAGARERYEVDARLFDAGIVTSIGVLHEPGHPQPWIIAMGQQPNRASVLDYGARWSIEPMFSDFKTRGFCLESTHLQAPDRLDRLLLIMTLAMYWCVHAGRSDALANPGPAEKKPGNRSTRITGACERHIEVRSHGSSGVCDC